MDHLSELRQKPIWVNYIRVWSDKKQGYSKPPINPRNLYNASTTNPEHWTDYQTAAGNIGKPGKIYQNGELIAEQPIEGVGLVLAKPLTGIDIDHVRDPETGEIQPFAKKIVEELDSYTEISPSGSGLHILIYDEESEDLAGEFKNIAPDGSISERGTAEIDAYNHKRYFTLTENMLLDKPIRKTSGALRKILTEYSEKKRKASGTEVQPKQTSSPVVSGVSEDSIRRMIESALQAIQPGELEFGEWAAVGSALKQLGFSCGVWEDWSRGNGNPKHVEGYTYRRWNKLQTKDEPERLILGLAKRFGWNAANTFSVAERWSYGRNMHTPEERAEYARQKAVEEAQKPVEQPKALDYRNLYINEDGSYTEAPTASQEHTVKQPTAQPVQPEQEEDTDLLTYDKAVNILQNANDQHIDIPYFDSFSKVAKIGQHDTVVLAGETGSGKSMLALNFMEYLNAKHPVIYFNLEMTKEMVLRRLVSIHTGLPLDQVEGYKNDQNTQKVVNQALKEITSRKPIHIVNDRYKVSEIEELIQKESAKNEAPTVVFIDHTLLVKLEGVSSGYERFTGISEELRRIALLNNCIMFVLTQQNRAGKMNKEDEPELGSLKESGSFENDATHVCFVWYSITDSTHYLVLRKNRKGESESKWELQMDKRTQTIKAPKLALPLKSVNTDDGLERLILPEARPTRRKKK